MNTKLKALDEHLLMVLKRVCVQSSAADLLLPCTVVVLAVAGVTLGRAFQTPGGGVGAVGPTWCITLVTPLLRSC